MRREAGTEDNREDTFFLFSRRPLRLRLCDLRAHRQYSRWNMHEKMRLGRESFSLCRIAVARSLRPKTLASDERHSCEEARETELP